VPPPETVVYWISYIVTECIMPKIRHIASNNPILFIFITTSFKRKSISHNYIIKYRGIVKKQFCSHLLLECEAMLYQTSLDPKKVSLCYEVNNERIQLCYNSYNKTPKHIITNETSFNRSSYLSILYIQRTPKILLTHKAFSTVIYRL
jgi:hypothetical protein